MIFRARHSRSLLALPVVLALSACGAGQLAPKFAPPETPTEAKVAENIVKAAPREERAVAVGLLADAPNLAAWDLHGTLLWELPVDAKSAPLVVGDAVVLREAAGVVVRDLATGVVRVTLDDGGELVGADAVGNAVVISLAFKDEAGPHGSVVFVVNDEVRWEKELSQPVGTPALVENQVLVPWGTQRLSVLSADDGAELARWNFHNLTLGQALVDRGRVFVGQLGWLKVEKDLPDHQDGPLTLTAPAKRPLPGQPLLLRDGYALVADPDNASHKVKIEWRPGGEPNSVEGDLAVFRFYRMAFGLAAHKDEVRWARNFEHDLVGASTQPGGVFLADDQGIVRFVDTAGSTRFKADLKKRVRVVALRPGAFVPPSAANQPALETPETSLHDQLLTSARLEDDRLYPARAFALQHLARTSDARVTSELLAFCVRKNGLSHALQISACEELGKREGNGPEILEALRQRASFLEGTSAPPVGALAQAAARSKLKGAGPLLVAHAEDPNTPASELSAIFQALEALEYAPAVAQIDRFVRLHHAEPAGSDLANAIQTALDVLGRMRARAARPTLESVANDLLTLEPVRQKAKEALVVLDTPVAKKEEPKAPEKAKQGVEPEPVLTDPRPYALVSNDVQKAFRPMRAALVRCLESDPGKPKSARISMIVTGAGNTEGFFVTPTTLQGCADAILRNAKFPETRLARQHVTQTVYAEGPSAVSPKVSESDAAKPAPVEKAAPVAKSAAPKQKTSKAAVARPTP